MHPHAIPQLPRKHPPKRQENLLERVLGEGSPALRGSAEAGTATIFETCTMVGASGEVSQFCTAPWMASRLCKASTLNFIRHQRKL